MFHFRVVGMVLLGCGYTGPPGWRDEVERRGGGGGGERDCGIYA